MTATRHGALAVALALAALVGLVADAAAFDLTRHSIPTDAILDGGPPKDGIPALDAPATVAAERAALRPSDRVVGVRLGEAARAYPIAVLNWHEAVNDTLDARPILVTYCPLTDSAVVFDRVIDGRIEAFGISGRLYQSNVLLYDRRGESLWSQLGAGAVTGARTGAALRAIPATVTTWADWSRAHPHTSVVGTATGHARDYGRDPYAGYHRSPDTAFPVRHRDERLPTKARVLGIELNGTARAYPVDALARAGRVEDTLAGRALVVGADPATGSATARDAGSGESLPATLVYWFAWAAFHPETSVWGVDGPARTPAPAPGVPLGSVDGLPEIEIVGHRAYWTALLDVAHRAAGSSADGPPLFVIRGDLRNVSSRPLRHVELVYELLDAAGTVVASERGYNLAGEALRPVEGDPELIAALPAVTPGPPLMPGDTDAFRMLFVGDEIPAFTRYRVRALRAASQ